MSEFFRLKKLVLILIFIPLTIYASGFEVDTNYPGGNIIVESISNDTVFVRPDLRDTEGDWFYWTFKVRGAENKSLTFQFTKPNVFSSAGPVMSRDGVHWNYLENDEWRDGSFLFHFSKTDSCVSFAVAIPYTQSNWGNFIQSVTPNLFLTIDTLCTSKNNRVVEKLSINSNKNHSRKVLITARHHACEMIANYVIEGIIASILKNDDLKWTRDNVEFFIIPFVDKDGVEQGDQGKNRKPRDHGRDYQGESIYNSTAAIRQLVPNWSDGHLDMILDIHCPWIKGQYNEFIYIVGSSDERNAVQQQVFAKLLEQLNKSELPFYENDFLPFGTAWNQISNYTKGISLASWGSALDGIELSTSLEVPYTTVYQQKVTKENARTFGESVAKSIQAYLQQINKQ